VVVRDAKATEAHYREPFDLSVLHVGSNTGIWLGRQDSNFILALRVSHGMHEHLDWR
jgi:hypothetical protein